MPDDLAEEFNPAELAGPRPAAGPGQLERGIGDGILPVRWVLLVRLSLPAMVGMMVQSIYFFVDRAFVGQGLDLDAVAGIMIAFPYMIGLQAASMLIGLGRGRASFNQARREEERRGRVDSGQRRRRCWLLASVVLTVAGFLALPYVLAAPGRDRTPSKDCASSTCKSLSSPRAFNWSATG